MISFYVDPQSYLNLEKYDLGVLSSFEHECYYFCSKKLSRSPSSNIKVRKIFSYSGKSAVSAFFSYFSSLLIILKEAVKIKPDIIHFQWAKVPFIDFFLYVILKLFLIKVKVVYTAHNVVPHNSKFISKAFYSLLYRVPDLIIVHEESAVDKIKEMSGAINVKVVKHGLIPFNEDGELGQDVLNIDFNNKTTFCFLGTASKYKGFDFMVSSWIDNLSKIDDIQLIIAGRTDSSIEMSNFTCGNIVSINRFLNEAELKFISENSCCCILPYLNISQSGVLLSVLSHRLPILVSNLDGLVEPLTVANVGWSFEVLNEDHFVNSIRYISSQSGRLNTLKRDNDSWGRISNFYSWASISKTTVSLYRSLFIK